MNNTLFMKKEYLLIKPDATAENICDDISQLTNRVCAFYDEHWRVDVSIDYRTIVTLVDRRFKSNDIPIAVIRVRRGNDRRMSTEVVIFGHLVPDKEDVQHDEESTSVSAES